VGVFNRAKPNYRSVAESCKICRLFAPSKTMSKLNTLWSTLSLALCLSACGGGGSSNTTPPVDPGTGSSYAVPDLGTVTAQMQASPLPEGWYRGAFMQIYVRAYKDSNGDGVGDLQGLISKLDYLQDLGVKGLWLMPVMQSQDRDHGYAVKHYRDIETDYGSLDDLKALIAQAHQRGMGVILDYVINHSSDKHPLFLNASSSRLNAQRDYYVWQDTAPSGWSIFGTNPWYNAMTGYYFAAFWSGMPDFNWKNDKVRAFHHDNLRFWLNLGVDGMRFDAVGNLAENGASAWNSQPESHTVMNAVQTLVKSYDKRYLVCEGPDAPQAFGAASSCGSAFAFDLKDAVIKAAKGDASSVQAVADYFKTAPAGMATFLANHDSFAGDRLWNQLGGDLAKYRLAAATYLLLPGTPFVYYGEEIGMGSGSGLSGDAALRAPMSWTSQSTGFSTSTPFRAVASNITSQNVASQVGVTSSLHSHYKSLLNLRNTWPSLNAGTYQYPTTSGSVLAFQRHASTQKALVLINYGTAAATVSLSNLPASITSSPGFGSAGALTTDATGKASLTLPAQSVQVYPL